MNSSMKLKQYTTSQIDALSGMTDGEMVYDTDLKAIKYYNLHNRLGKSFFNWRFCSSRWNNKYRRYLTHYIHLHHLEHLLLLLVVELVISCYRWRRWWRYNRGSPGGTSSVLVAVVVVWLFKAQ